MKNYLIIIFYLVCGLCGISNTSFKRYDELKKQSIKFIENKGQICDQNNKTRADVLFSGGLGGMTYFLRNNGISYQFVKTDHSKEIDNAIDVIQNRYSNKNLRNACYIAINRIDINWLGINIDIKVEPDGVQEGFDNYYTKAFPNGALNVKSFKSIFYKNIYDNITLHYYEKEGNIKYDYIVEPQADYTQIKFDIGGAEKIEIENDGSLKLETALGIVKEDAPLVYQEQKQLKARWVLNNNVLGFKIDEYDPTKQMIIDPVIRSWGTYFGGSYEDYGGSLAKDGFGNIYLAGSTMSSNNIATTGSYQTSLVTSETNAFLVKFNNDGVRQWSTYYGSNRETASSCVTDIYNNVYLAGTEMYWANTVAITTAGAFQQNFGGGITDCFLVKFNSNGVRQWATFYGGTDDDSGGGLAADRHGNIYLTGVTGSTNLATPGTQQTIAGGGADCFLAKFDSNGNRLWATYCGGNDIEYTASCCVDILNNVYLAGSTGSTNNISSANAHQQTYAGGYDAFLVKYDSLGTRLWGTYYGGSSAKEDWSSSCSTDKSGSVYLAGTAGSDSSISTPNSHQPIIGGGLHGDAFLAQFKSSGELVWCTYYGGINDDFGVSCSSDDLNNVYLAGYSSSSSGTTIATMGSPQSTYGGGASDAFLVKFNNAGTRLWGTYYGGSDGGQSYYADRAVACIANSSVSAFLSGSTKSFDQGAISSPFSYQEQFGGFEDSFLAKFSECSQFPLTSINSNSNVLCKGETKTLTAHGAISYVWSNGLAGSSTVVSPSVTTTYTVLGFDDAGCFGESSLTLQVDLCTGVTESQSDLNEIYIYPNPTIDKFKINSNLVSGNTIEIYNSFGQRINTFYLQNETEIDISNYANGIYFVKIYKTHNFVYKKMIKE